MRILKKNNQQIMYFNIKKDKSTRASDMVVNSTFKIVQLYHDG